MASAIRAAWTANRHRVSAGLLFSAALFLLLNWATWHGRNRSTASQKVNGLGAAAWDQPAMWQQRSIVPSFRAHNRPKNGAVGVVGGVPGASASAEVVNGQLSAPPDRQVIRTGVLQIVAADPTRSAEQLSDLATRLSGFVLSSKVSGTDDRTRSAQIVLRIPAAAFDDARAQVRKLATSVAEDNVEARDVTREYVDEDAKLNNYRAEEAQYLAILKRATAVRDVVEVTAKLDEVRGEIEELEADLRLLRHEVEMSQLTIGITAVPEAQAFWIAWRPLYQAKISLREAVASLADYADSMLALVLYLPVIAVWAITILALLKIGWMALRRLFLFFFPKGIHWLRAPAQAG